MNELGDMHLPDPVPSSDTKASKFCQSPPDPSTLEDIWKTQYRHLKQFKEIYGHANVPQHYNLDPYLRHWVYIQREQFQWWKVGKQSTMTFPRYEALNQSGFLWENSNGSPEPNLVFSTPQEKSNQTRWFSRNLRQDSKVREVTPCSFIQRLEEMPKEICPTPPCRVKSNDDEDLKKSFMQAAIALFCLSNAPIKRKWFSDWWCCCEKTKILLILTFAEIRNRVWRKEPE